jgi:hypothetical protein
MQITEMKFKAATGRLPEQDDLDRCNCNQAGQIGHFCCGWDAKANLPRFETFGSDSFINPIAHEQTK